MQRLFCAFFLLLIPSLVFCQLSMIELEVKPIPEPYTKDSIVEKWNLAQPGYQQLPQQAKEMLYWTNFCRYNPKKCWDSALAPVIKLYTKLNSTEAKSLEMDLIHIGSLPMFKLNPVLIRTARLHAADISEKGVMPSHNSTNGTEFGRRMQLAGILSCANENISLCSQSILLSVVLLYLDIGLPGLGHRRALLDPYLREIGIGSALYGKDQYFLVQDFACAQ